MKLQAPHLAALVLAGATAATLALLPFIGAGPEPAPGDAGAEKEPPARTEPQGRDGLAPAPELPPSGGSLSLLRQGLNLAWDKLSPGSANGLRFR